MRNSGDFHREAWSFLCVEICGFGLIKGSCSICERSGPSDNVEIPFDNGSPRRRVHVFHADYKEFDKKWLRDRVDLFVDGRLWWKGKDQEEGIEEEYRSAWY